MTLLLTHIKNTQLHPMTLKYKYTNPEFESGFSILPRITLTVVKIHQTIWRFQLHYLILRELNNTGGVLARRKENLESGLRIAQNEYFQHLLKVPLTVSGKNVDVDYFIVDSPMDGFTFLMGMINQ